MQIDITNDDIEYAERLLLPSGGHFNEERRAFIRCLESRDVVACPGSGKTTALLAKLLILARKAPFADSRGICVLTHTNVAIDLIREKAAAASVSLFHYPNFFGTIQSFVNQFLAVPWYRCEFGRPVVAIDNDRFFSELNHLYAHAFDLRRWLEPKGGLSTLGSYWFNPATLEVGRTLDEPLANLSNSTPTFKKIQSVRKSVLEQGILSFNDAYSLALRYLLKMPDVAKAISSRFCVVLMDEAQDTDEHQFKVLDAAFAPGKVTVQRIGDPNQAIYHDHVQAQAFWFPREPLHFSDSRRYGTTITGLLDAVRLDDSITLQPCPSANSYSPHLIAFEQGEEQSVIPAFASLVMDLTNGLSPSGSCAAIGWIGKDGTTDDKLCIPSYFPQYDRAVRVRNRRFANLLSYAAHAIRLASTERDSVKRFYDVIIQGLVHALDVTAITDPATGCKFTPSMAQEFWKREHRQSFDHFRAQIITEYLSTLQSNLAPICLRNQIVEAIKSVWPSLCAATAFFADDQIDRSVEMDQSIDREPNQFVAQNGIVVDIGTVHSVKGETHYATLYLETKYQKDWDASRLIEFLKGNRPIEQLKKAHHQQNLKIAHVAFSRPTHLLAFACRNSCIRGHEDGLRANGWVIRSVAELCSRYQEPRS